MSRIRTALLAVVLAALVSPVALGASTPESPHAVLSDAARAHTYAGAMTARWRSLLESEVPRANLYLGMSKGDEPQPLLYAVAATTAQGRPVERPDGSIVAASCRPGSCEERGLIWVSNDGVVAGAIVHFYYGDPKAPMSPSLLLWSRDVSANALPHGFVMALTEWLRQPVTSAGFKAIRMTGRGGATIDVTPRQLLP